MSINMNKEETLLEYWDMVTLQEGETVDAKAGLIVSNSNFM